MQPDRPLEGRCALVTGGSGDIGGAICEALCDAGANVALTYLGERDAARARVEAIRSRGRRSFAVQLDQRDPKLIDTCIQSTVTALGALDILINNAAWNVGIPFRDLDALGPETFDRVLETNLRGPYLLARAAAPRLRVGGRGRIVNIASTGGLYPASSSIAYSVSKAGLIHLTRCLAVALAPEVTVNCVAPGLVEGTRMAERLPPEVAEMARGTAVLGRVGSAADVARQVVAFCAAESVSGQVVAVDGGMPGAMR